MVRGCCFVWFVVVGSLASFSLWLFVWFVARSLGGLLVSVARWFGGSFGLVVVCLGLVQFLVRFEFSSLYSVVVGLVVV